MSFVYWHINWNLLPFICVFKISNPCKNYETKIKRESLETVFAKTISMFSEQYERNLFKYNSLSDFDTPFWNRHIPIKLEKE
jgi:hypothetical protein